jgi:hypothetical protein
MDTSLVRFRNRGGKDITDASGARLDPNVGPRHTSQVRCSSRDERPPTVLTGATSSQAAFRYGVGDGLGVTDGEADPVALGVVDPEALTEADAEEAAEPEADADPLGTGVVLGVGLGLGEGKSFVGTLANESAKMSTKMTTTPITQSCARLSVRGGSAPRYPGAGGSGLRSDAERR